MSQGADTEPPPRGTTAAGPSRSAGDAEASAAGALSDIRVLDLTRLLPGGFCSQMLADFGAEVLKVEDTGLGDYIRWAPPYYDRRAATADGGAERDDAGAGADGTGSALYLSLNRNKRSIRLDLKQEAGREALLRLVAEHDVVLEGFRPGVLDRLGVGYERMREVNPGIVYCAITGYGQDGPYRDRAGHDQNYLALNGILGLTGPPPAMMGGPDRGGRDEAAGAAAVGDASESSAGDAAGRPESPPALAGAQIADVAGGAMSAAFGVMAALHERRRSGEGQLVDISMTDGSLAMLAMVAGRYFCDGEVPRRGEGQLSGGLICYLPYEAADGWISCGALEPKFWAAFCNGVDRPDLIGSQFEVPGSDAWREVAAIFRSRTRDEWTAFNREHDCCIEPVLDLDQVLESDLVGDRQMVLEWDQPGLGPVRQLGVPAKLSRTPGSVHRPAPALGEHTAEVLAAAGYSAAEIASLLEAGAAAGPPEPAAEGHGADDQSDGGAAGGGSAAPDLRF